MSNAVWTSLSKESRYNIISRLHNGESIKKLADEYNLLEVSLARKIRKLKASGAYNIILKKPNKNLSVAPEVKTKTSPFIGAVNMQKRGSYQSSSYLTFYREDKNPEDRITYIDSSAQWSGLYFTDIHCPFQDNASVNAMLRVLKNVDHNILINGGDNLDLYGLSVYAKDPEMLFQNNFHKEVEAHNHVMEKIADASDALKISLYGNHMQRYDKWINNTPAMSIGFLKSQLSLDSILSMAYYGWQPFQGTVVFTESNSLLNPKPKLLIEHGTAVSRGAGKSSMSQFKSYGACSYIMGHVHRIGVNYMRTLHGQHAIAEGGTLRNLDPEYMRYPDWQNGMLHFMVDGDTVTVTPILIQNGIAYIGNSKI